jgi:site-specific DNA-methyltransferase (adenine-specific)
MWYELQRIIKPKGAIVLFGNEPFSSKVRCSNLSEYKYDWKWVKNRATGFPNCNYRPMNKYEDIMVFSKANASTGGSKNSMVYYPQNLIESGKVKKTRLKGTD